MSLLIRDGRIAEISPSAGSLTAQHPGAEVVDASEKIILPGFVNAHYHGESFLLRTITGRRAFASWPALTPFKESVARLVGPTPASLLEGLYAVAGSVHVQHGTTCVGEYPLAFPSAHLDAVRAGYALAGLRHVTVLQTWDQIEGTRAHAPGDDDVVLLSLGKEDEYTIYSFENHTRVSRDRHLPLCAHIAEQPADVERLRKNFKKSPLVVLKEYGALKATTQVIHGNYLGTSDLTTLKSAGASLTLCPLSATSKRTGYPLLARLAHADVRMSIGTDWGATDMMAEIKLLRMLPNLVGGVRHFSPLELLRMATINGAHALGVGMSTGSLEVGKRADLVLLSPEHPGFPEGRGEPSPEEIAGMVVDHLDRGSITDVLIGGKFVFQRGRKEPGERTAQQEAFRLLQNAFVRRGAVAPEGSTRKSVPLLAPGEGLVAGFGSPVPADLPVAPGGLNMTMENPVKGDQAVVPASGRPQRVKKVFGENDF
jgi:cytosine/adenosine deaminase-related metal-dependent hydrolase